MNQSRQVQLTLFLALLHTTKPPARSVAAAPSLSVHTGAGTGLAAPTPQNLFPSLSIPCESSEWISSCSLVESAKAGKLQAASLHLLLAPALAG